MFSNNCSSVCNSLFITVWIACSYLMKDLILFFYRYGLTESCNLTSSFFSLSDRAILSMKCDVLGEFTKKKKRLRFGRQLTLTSSPSLEICCFLWKMYWWNPYNAPTCIEHICGGLTLASCQTPTQPLSYFPFSTGQGEKLRGKILWVGTRTGRSLTKYIQGQHRINLGKINLTYSQFEKERDREKQRPKKTSPLTPSFLPDSA